MDSSIPASERSPDRLRAHYEIEKELAARLRLASKDQRRHLYSELYDELFRRVPDHPQLVAKSGSKGVGRNLDIEMKLLEPVLNGSTTFMEVGPGDCALSLRVAAVAKRVYAVDVSDEITKSSITPSNFSLALSDGCSIPVPVNSVNVAFSNQLMEHLHPDDAYEQLKNIYRVLAPAGVYVCITPNKLNGPHDISMYFDQTATGFHLHEYTVSELHRLFKDVGFSKVRIVIGGKGLHFTVPVFLSTICERILTVLPHTLRRNLAGSVPFRNMLEIRFFGYK